MAVGYQTNRLIAANSTNATIVAARPAQVTGWYLYNAAVYTVFFKLYNSATIPTAGSGTPIITIGVPAGAAANVDFGDGAANGLNFDAGVGFTITKLAADNDTTVLLAGDLVVNLFYR